LAEQFSQRVLSIRDEEAQAHELQGSTVQHIAAAGLNLIALKGACSGKQPENILEDSEASLEAASHEQKAKGRGLLCRQCPTMPT
jgi:hypothetical protein